MSVRQALHRDRCGFAAADAERRHAALEAQNLKRGVAALCIGGGEATAIAVERLTH